MKIKCVLLFCMALLTSCQSKVDWLNARPPQDVLWGIGRANMNSSTMSMTIAQTRARASIARQLAENIDSVFTEYGHNADTEAVSIGSINEYVRQSIIRADLSGAKIISTWQDPDGTFWCVVEYRKSDARDMISVILHEQEERHGEFIAQHAMRLFDAHLAGNNRPPVVDR